MTKDMVSSGPYRHMHRSLWDGMGGGEEGTVQCSGVQSVDNVYNNILYKI